MANLGPDSIGDASQGVEFKAMDPHLAATGDELRPLRRQKPTRVHTGEVTASCLQPPLPMQRRRFVPRYSIACRVSCFVPLTPSTT